MFKLLNSSKNCAVSLDESQWRRLNMSHTTTAASEFYHCPTIVPFEQSDHSNYTLNQTGHFYGVGKSTSTLGNNNNNLNDKNHNISSAAGISCAGRSYVIEQTPAKSYVDDLHNYSKPRFAANWATEVREMNGDVESDEESDEEMEAKMECNEEAPEVKNDVDLDDSGIHMVEEEKLTPDHHARRPMNAFLIFCKRHRAIVREKYPNLENRAITKILGDWWANMDINEKACFTDLAKEYKDAFFNANPNFKWYKLPAPPLRTLSTRPANAERGVSFLDYESGQPQHSVKTEHRTNGIRDFKLADETEMGGISNLIASYSTAGGRKASGKRVQHNREDEHLVVDSLNNNRNDSFTIFPKSTRISTNRTEPFCQERVVVRTQCKTTDHSKADKKRPSSTATIVTSPQIDFERFVQANWAEPIEDTYDLPSPTADFPNTNGSKSARACKGKRYLEFINTVKVNTVTKKTSKPYSKPLHTSTSIRSECYRSPDSKPKHVASDRYHRGGPKTSVTTSTEPPKLDDAKLFDAIDFDLDSKINAITALNLELYLLRKRDTKKKRKITTKRGPTAKGPQTIQEAKELLLKRAVGSQKRKARKESITRRDITVSPAAIDLATNPIEDQLQNIVAHRAISPEIASSDLFILAEVAAAVTN